MSRMLLGVLILSFLGLKSQNDITIDLTKEVKTIDGQTLKNPWIGGLNSVHLSEIDLNFDGILDLFIYDLDGQRKLTFINGGTNGEVDYTLAPEYAAAFPDIENFFQFLDYNKDGKKDLFIAYNGGIKVYKNTSDENLKELSFEEYSYLDGFPFLTADYSGQRSNLYVARGDAPAIVDVDFDGDLDVLSFSNLGGRVNYYVNSAAQKGDFELLDFQLGTSCWGNFEEGFDSPDITLGVSCKGNGGTPKDKGNKHAGSTLLAFDADGDNDMDLLVGDILSYTMIFLENGGDSLFADMVSQTQLYPSDRPIDIRIYPAAHYLDLNNDGKRDLVITPNTLGAVENAESLWYYLNTGSDNAPVFKFIKSNLFQDECIETGEGAYPAFFDYNNDSIPDLIIGNYGYYNEAELARSVLQLYQSDEDFNFELLDTNVAGIDKIILNENLGTPTLNLIPTFGDLDGDGDKDLIIGDFEGKIHHFNNTAGKGLPARFVLTQRNYQDIDVGGYAAPQLFDLNQDGLLDLIIGERNGILNYYENAGTRFSPEFTLVTDSLGGVVVVPEFNFTGYSYPFFFWSNDTLKLLCGSQSGTIFYYNNISNNLEGKFALISDSLGGIDVGSRSSIAGADHDGDGLLELVIGNYSGGVTYFQTDMAYSELRPGSGNNSNPDRWQFSILPVPSDGLIRLISKDEDFNDLNLDIRIYNPIGRLVYEKSNTTQKNFDLRGMAGGIYFIQLTGQNKEEVQSFVIQGGYETN